MSDQKTAIIIGAGIGGLGLASILARAGWAVDIYEQSSSAGGRAGVWQKDGYRFDTGPSWYLMPEVFEHYFDLIGEQRSDYFELERLTPAYKVFLQNEPAVTITGSIAKDSKIFESLEAGAGEQLNRYLKRAEKTYTLAVKYFLYNPFRSLKPLFKKDIVTSLPFMMKQLTRPIHSYISRFVEKRVLQQILEYPMVFLGTSPYKAPALYHLMSHMDFEQGVFFPKGGIYKVIEALESISKMKGVRFHFNSPVTKILHSNGQAKGVLLKDGQQKTADIVVSNADLHFTETQLLDEAVQTYPQKYWDKKVAGPSALLMYLGVKGGLPELEHHNLLFVDDWQKNFQDIFENKVWPDSASIYISRTTATDKTAAPKGQENVFVLVPLPSGVSEDLDTYAGKYLKQIEDMTGIKDFRDRITFKKLYGPDDFTKDFNAWEGTALGMSHILTQSAMFRPSTKSKKLKNLYYVGGGAQPGIGLPMCLISAELVYKNLIGDTTAGPLERIR